MFHHYLILFIVFLGHCLSMLPSPPSNSPTNSAMESGFWYADFDTPFSKAGCLNKLPLPFNNPQDRVNYPTQLECCKAAYGGQMSGMCLSQLSSPPTTSNAGSGVRVGVPTVSPSKTPSLSPTKVSYFSIV